MQNLKLMAVLGAVLALAACGSNPTDRAVTGGALGAGVGAAGAAITGGSALGGAVIGGAAGAVAGAVTDEGDVDLGEPIYK